MIKNVLKVQLKMDGLMYTYAMQYVIRKFIINATLRPKGYIDICK